MSVGVSVLWGILTNVILTWNIYTLLNNKENKLVKIQEVVKVSGSASDEKVL